MAVLALAISIWQSYSIQQHNKLSLRPYLETEFNSAKNGSWDLYINNHGMGPAQTVDLQYIVDGKRFTNRDAFLVALGEDPNCYGRGNIGRFYRVNDRQMVFMTLDQNCFKSEEQIEAMFKRAKIVLDYQSLYGENYQLVIGDKA